MTQDHVDPHTLSLKTLEAGTPFRFHGHRYVVEAEADSIGLVKARDQKGASVVFTSEAMVEKSS